MSPGRKLATAGAGGPAHRAHEAPLGSGATDSPNLTIDLFPPESFSLSFDSIENKGAASAGQGTRAP